MNYRKGNLAVIEAWFKYKKTLLPYDTPSVVSFVAGFNAAEEASQTEIAILKAEIEQHIKDYELAQSIA